MFYEEIQMEDTNSACWEDLLPDALGLIFKNLSLQERLTVIPLVCKSWNKAVTGPYCWQEIDIEEWSNRSDPANVDRMLQMLIVRSSGSLRKLCVSGLLSEPSFYFIADHAHSIQTLRLPRSDLNDTVMEKIAGKFCNISCLDLSYCSNIGARALEAVGKNCKSLTRFSRNMHPLDVEGKLPQKDEAHAIATTMPKLKHLEMAYHLIDTIGFLEIISSCLELEFLDLRGCWEVKFDEKSLEEEFPKLNVLGPHIVDHYERHAWEDCSDYSDSLYDYESSDGVWDDEDRLELRFYGGFDGYDDGWDYGWPPSP